MDVQTVGQTSWFTIGRGTDEQNLSYILVDSLSTNANC